MTSFYDRFYKIGETVEIEIVLGLDTKRVKAVIIGYLGNNEYEVETENGNRYIRNLGGKDVQ